MVIVICMFWCLLELLNFIGVIASFGVVDLIGLPWVACLITLVSTDLGVAESID